LDFWGKTDVKLRYNVETEQEADGRWIAEISDLPGVMAYGQTKEEAVAEVEALVAGKDYVGSAQ